MLPYLAFQAQTVCYLDDAPKVLEATQEDGRTNSDELAI